MIHTSKAGKTIKFWNLLLLYFLNNIIVNKWRFWMANSMLSELFVFAGLDSSFNTLWTHKYMHKFQRWFWKGLQFLKRLDRKLYKKHSIRKLNLWHCCYWLAFMHICFYGWHLTLDSLIFFPIYCFDRNWLCLWPAN